MARIHTRRARSLIALATEYAEQDDSSDELIIPEDLTALDNDALAALSTQAQEAFDAIYGEGTDLTAEELDQLAAITEGIEALHAEQGVREAAAAERSEAAAALAARVRPEAEAAPEGDEDEDENEDGEEEAGDESDEDSADTVEVEGEVVVEESLAASARKPVRVNLRGLRSRSTAPEQTSDSSTRPSTMRDVVHAAPETGIYASGQGLDFSDMGRIINHRLTGFNQKQFESAARAGKHLRQQFGVATVAKPFEDDLVLRSSDPAHVSEVLDRAVDDSRLPGGSLVASGGWCAPSDTLYDLYDIGVSRDGLFSLPEVGVARGGIRFTQGVDFSSVYTDVGFHYTEEEDEEGDYDGEGGGSKPCLRVECPEFDEERLELDGLCITAGLLQRRGYPEAIANVVQNALVAHDHRISAGKIAKVVAGSTAVTMPTTQAGATAPLLTAIELQTEHYRHSHRLGRATVLEGVFPYWVRGVIRSDLSRRLGVDLISVPDSRIDGWFRERNINPQFVYNWQDISTTEAASFTAWPTSVDFLLYKAGTWVAGGGEVITLDTIYDSINLGTNDYTALFTEEGTLVAKRGTDSRLVTVGLAADGATHGGIDIAHDGTVTD